MLTALDNVEQNIRSGRPFFWANPRSALSFEDPLGDLIDEAEDRFVRSIRLFHALFPETAGSAAPIKSALLAAPKLAAALGATPSETGRWFVKADHALPIAGSVKARGGFHEVLAHAERLARWNKIVAEKEDLLVLSHQRARQLFAQHRIVVGSTGNLGMSIGLMASALGFQAVVHMSSDAKGWKKRRLRDHGVEVMEHEGDYAAAVAAGREIAAADPAAHFVDDEQSIDLMVGYAAAARELVDQLKEAGIAVDSQHPLFVYLPCGVGGAPGGIAYGLRRLLGQQVHCIFAEPVESPCMLVQMAIGGDAPLSVYDLGLTNKTDADGLAVGQASMLVAPLMRDRLDAIYTVSDEQLLSLVRADLEGEGFGVEPSAATAFAGPAFLKTRDGAAYLRHLDLDQAFEQATHLFWATGGALVPADERKAVASRALASPRFRLDP